MSSKTFKVYFTSIGGQAVIEGVMMRSPHFIAVAVRKPDQRNRHQESSLPRHWSQPHSSFEKTTILRGVVTLLIESMVQGVDALSYSANIASADKLPIRQIQKSFRAGPIVHFDCDGIWSSAWDSSSFFPII